MPYSRDELIALRNHLRLAWRANAGACHYLVDALKTSPQFWVQRDPTFRSPEAAALVYLTTGRSFIRTADKAAGAIGAGDLQAYRRNLDGQFPGHKNARDIIEHFEDYALGEGRLQGTGRIFEGEPITVSSSNNGSIIIQVFDLEPIELSKLAWWIDGFNFFIERSLYSAIDPGVEWKGLWPQYGHDAPPDWRER